MSPLNNGHTPTDTQQANLSPFPPPFSLGTPNSPSPFTAVVCIYVFQRRDSYCFRSALLSSVLTAASDTGIYTPSCFLTCSHRQSATGLCLRETGLDDKDHLSTRIASWACFPLPVFVMLYVVHMVRVLEGGILIGGNKVRD